MAEIPPPIARWVAGGGYHFLERGCRSRAVRTSSYQERTILVRYMLLIYSQQSPDRPGRSDTDSLMMGETANQHRSLLEETGRLGILRGADPLQGAATARTVRTNQGTVSVTDGPFAETKEQLAGYYILDCSDMHEAIELAKKIPTDCFGGCGCVEVRPIHEIYAAP
jgi:hypothetical protein